MRWAAVIIWVSVIFILSTENFSSASTRSLLSDSTLDYSVRKLAHWTEYFILAALLMRALKTEAGAQTKRDIIWSVSLAVIYAISDEWHQSFVSSRNAKFTDVVIDTCGAFCGAWAWTVYLRNIHLFSKC